MKMTRKLIPALVMLLVSAIMLSTASYAWFASNSTVAANNMHVKVKANTQFLEISKSKDTDFSTAVDYETAGLAGEGTKLVTQKTANTDGTVDVNWYIGSSSSESAVGTTDMMTAIATWTDGSKPLTADYALINEMYVRASEKSDLGFTKFMFDTVTVAAKEGEIINPLANALRVLVVATDADNNTIIGTGLWKYGGEMSYVTKDGTNASILPAVAVKETYKLTVYVYFDGEDSSAITDNTDGLEELIVSVSFKATT